MNDALAQTLKSQRAASDPAASAWVAANAGSGKTTVLVNRVVRLLLNGTAPDRILCLTFTKAAAAEMSNRIFKTLGSWSTLSDDQLTERLAAIEGGETAQADLAQARVLFAKALETPGGLKIQTIHAFCQAILNRFPLEARVVPHFQVMDEYTTSTILAEAQHAFLDFAAGDEDWEGRDRWQSALSMIGEYAVQGLIEEICNNRFQLADFIRRHGNIEQAANHIWKELGFVEPTTPDAVVVKTLSDLDEAKLEVAIAALRNGTDKDRERADKFALVLKASNRLDLWPVYRDVFLTKEGTCRAERGLITKKAREAAPAAADFLFREQARVFDAQQRLKSARLAVLSETMLHVADEIIDQYEARKRQEGLLDYDDLIEKTAEMLRFEHVAAWVLYKLDGGIDHILVDEAQDTNPTQWDVVQLIADEFFAGEGVSSIDRSIFAVGDEKQSIYSFQGADPAEFDQRRQHFESAVQHAEKTWRKIDLNLSFRSTAQVLNLVDRVFEAEERRQDLTAAGSAIRHEAARMGAAGRVELWPTIVPDEEEADDPWDAPVDQLGTSSPQSLLADRISNTIASWIDQKEILPSKGRPIKPSDILILVRRRNSFVDELIRKLKIKQVPVAGVDRMVLTDQISVMDLMALADFALLPEDDLTLAVVLKGPFIGLDEEALFDVAHNRGGSLWQSVQTKAADRPAFGEAVSFLSEILAMADYVPPFEFFAHVLNARGGRARLAQRLGPDALDPVDEFLRLALSYDRVDVPSLQGFLQWLRHSEAIIQRDFDHGRDEVRIMTVHGAKGLEANIVFLPDTCGLPSAQHDPKLLTVPPPSPTESPTLLWVPQKAFDVEQSETSRLAERQKRDAEHQRLLYVAMTRASDRLYVCGYETARGRPEGCWYDLIEAAIKPEAVEVPGPDGTSVWRIDGEQADKVTPDVPVMAAATSSAEELPEWAGQAYDLSADTTDRLQPSRLLPDEDHLPVIPPAMPGGRDRFKRGRLIHRLLELLPELRSQDHRDAALRYLAQPALGVAENERDGIAAEVIRILQDESFSAVFGPGSKAEVPLVGTITVGDRAVAVNGQVDRLLVKDDRVLVIDYKTNRPPPTEVGEVSVAYLRQMAVYRALLSGLFPDRTVSCALLWTDGPRLMSLPGPQLDQAFKALNERSPTASS